MKKACRTVLLLASAMAGPRVGVAVSPAAQSELQALKTVPSSEWNRWRGSAPDANGYTGRNAGYGTPGGPTSLNASEQKRGIDRLVVGIIKNDDALVAQGWAALRAGFDLQNADGSFVGVTTGEYGFMPAWSSHAIMLLRANPRYATTYASDVAGLMPNVSNSLSFLLNTTNKEAAWGNSRGWGNRAFINANAFALSSLALDSEDYAQSSATRTAALAEAKRYTDRIFVNDFLYRPRDGVFYEGGRPNNADPPTTVGSDSSYQSVSLRFGVRLNQFLPELTAGMGDKLNLAATWMAGMIEANGVASTEGNVRTGPLPATENKSVDTTSVGLSLLQHAAIAGDAVSLAAAQRFNGTYETNPANWTPPTISPIADRTTSVGTPVIRVPFVVSDRESPTISLTVTAATGTPSALPGSALAFEGTGADRTLLISVPPTTGRSTVTLTVMDQAYPGQSGRTAASSFDVSITAASPTARWVGASDGTWSTNTNWTPYAPDDVGGVAEFIGAASPLTVTLDGPRTIGTLRFGGSNGYSIVGTAALSMRVGAGAAAIEVLSADHRITAPLSLDNPLSIAVQSGSLSIDDLRSNGQRVTKTGAGTLALSTFDATARLFIEAGRVVVRGATAINQLLAASNGAGVTLSGGSLDLDYAGSATPATQLESRLLAGSATLFSTGPFQAIAPDGKSLGWVDFPGSSTIRISLTWRGDINLDGNVNFDDLVGLAQHYAQTGSARWADGDVNYDRAVDFNDLVALAQNYGRQSLSQSNVAAWPIAADWLLARSLVPEPISLQTALIVIGVLARRRRMEQGGHQ